MTSTFFDLKKKLSFRGISTIFPSRLIWGLRLVVAWIPATLLTGGQQEVGDPKGLLKQRQVGGWQQWPSRQGHVLVEVGQWETWQFKHTCYTLCLLFQLNRYLHREFNFSIFIYLMVHIKQMQQLKKIFNTSHLHIMVAWGHQSMEGRMPEYC